MKRFLNVVFLAILPCLSLARPVSYPGGITLMQTNDMDSNSLHIHYSPTAKFSVGYKGEYWRENEWQFHGVQINHLLKRWNKPASQANFYMKYAAGTVIDKNNNADPGAFAGFAFDWEDRRYFTSYENRFFNARDIDRFFMQKARLGIAPYIGDYGDLHTWLMLQVNHRPEQENNLIVTPLIRVFKREYLAEFGVSEEGDALINLIIRF